MHFPTRALLVAHLMTTLCATTRSEEIPLTCPDTAGRQLKDISEYYKCKPYFIPKLKIAKCDGAVNLHSDRSGKIVAKVTLAFKVLMKVPEGTAMCLGLQKMSVKITQTPGTHEVLSYSFDFNPLLAVGILTSNDSTSKDNRWCRISLLTDVLNLTILSKFKVWEYSFWNLSSPLLGTQLKWIQGLSITYNVALSIKFQIIWLERLQNTSIQKLNVGDVIGENMEILLKDMPCLREIYFHGASLTKFHQDSFLGMAEMEVLKIHDSRLSGIPPMIDRMPKLKTLEIVNGEPYTTDFTIPTKALSTLKELQVLDLKNNQLDNISGRLPPLSKLRVLKLDVCALRSIEESDLVGYPLLLVLTLSSNGLRHLKENTFRPLKILKVLNLSFNMLRNWPVLYDFSFMLLDMSGNLLSDVFNLGNTRTTVGILNISSNRILEWDDKYVFSLQKSLISNDEQRSKLTKSHSENSQKLSARGNSEKIIVNNFENSIESSSLIKYEFWVGTLDISKNFISGLSETMIQSLEGIHEVDLGGNEFNCVDCRMIPFQKWLNTTWTNVKNLRTPGPLLCSSPPIHKGKPVNHVQFDEEPCLEKVKTQGASLLILIGVPVGVISLLALAAAGGIYKFRLQIGYMLHLYKIRRRALAFSQSAFNKYAFDAFICYSCNDRRFVLTRLAPLLEKGEEQYRLCLHERDFPLGSHIVSNIVGSIQHSRKTIIVLSEHFIKSKWCKWEMEMANHKMFNEDGDFLILIQLEKMNRNKLPRHLQFLMDTRTYMEWPSPGQSDEEERVIERLKTALGPSIFQTTKQRPPLLSEVMEEY